MTLPFDPNDPFQGISARARLNEADPDLAGLEAKLRTGEQQRAIPSSPRRPGLFRRILRSIRGGGD